MQFNTISVSAASLGFDPKAGQRTQVARIGRLIKKLELDREILADPDAEKDEADN